MKKDEFEKDIQLIKDKTPNVYNEIIKVTNPFFSLYNELFAINRKFLQEKYSISMSELDILASLFYSGGNTFTLSPTKLRERILFSSGGMTKVLKKLENKKLIIRLVNKEDGRNKLVQITDDGINLTQEALRNLLKNEANYFSPLNSTEKEKLSKLLRKCLQN